MGAVMPTALRKQAEWFRLFLDSYCVDTYFPTEVEAEMCRIKVSRPEVVCVVHGCNITAYDQDAGVTYLTLEDENYDGRRLRVSIEVENTILTIRIVWVERADGD